MLGIKPGSFLRATHIFLGLSNLSSPFSAFHSAGENGSRKADPASTTLTIGILSQVDNVFMN